jgi:hypothetical protein
MSYVAIPQTRLTLLSLRLLLVLSGDPHMTVLAEICPSTYVLAYAEAFLGRQALWPYGAISAPSRNRVSQLCYSSLARSLGHRLTMP